MSSIQNIGACAILVNSLGKVLLGKCKNSYKAGMYGFPGGRIEFNEPILTTIIREVQEETGIVHHDFEYVGVVRENQEEFDFIHFVFVANVGDAEPTLCEPDKCEGWEWHDLHDLPTNLLPGHAAAIALHSHDEEFIDITG